TGGAPPYYRAHPATGAVGFPVASPSAIPPLDCALGNRARAAARRTVGVRLEAAGAAAINSGIFGVAIMASVCFGPELHHSGVTFRLWAPAAKRVDVMLGRPYHMQAQAEGWYEVTIPGARAGTLYKYCIDGEMQVPDPASHFQPHDVLGPSEVIDHDRFEWRTNGWRGRPWEDAVFLEVHI